MAFDARAATQDILSRIERAGFALAGIAPVRASGWAEHVRAWLKSGRHGTMDYLERDLEVRLRPERILPGARAFIMVGDQYASRNDAPDAAADVRDYVMPELLRDIIAFLEVPPPVPAVASK